MKKIEILDVILDTEEAHYNYDPALFRNSITYTVRSENSRTIKENGISDIRHWIEEGEKILVLPTNTTVYFDSSVVFPRRKFRSCFSSNKITNKPENADVIIIDKDKIQRELIVWSTNTSVCNDGHVTKAAELYNTDEIMNKVNSSIAPENYIFTSYRMNLTEFADRANDIIRYESKKILDITNLSLCSDEELSLDNFIRISKMLAGSDDQMRNLGMHLVTAYNYEKEKYRIMALLALNWKKWERGVKKTNVEIKSMLRKLKLDNKEFESSWSFEGVAGNGFWMTLSLECPDDEVVQYAFSEWIKNFIEVESNDRYKLVKIT